MNGYAPEKHRLARGLRKNERVCLIPNFIYLLINACPKFP